MQLQDLSLSKDSQGADVSLLHFGLRVLGRDIPKGEQLENRFGDGTYEAVGGIQKEFGLNVTGVVDAHTAKFLEQMINERVPRDKLSVRGWESIGDLCQRLNRLDPGQRDYAQELARIREIQQALEGVPKWLETQGLPKPRSADMEQALKRVQDHVKRLTDLSKRGQDEQFIVKGRVLLDNGLPARNTTLP